MARAYTAANSWRRDLKACVAVASGPRSPSHCAHEKSRRSGVTFQNAIQNCSERQRDQDTANINSGFSAQLGLYLWWGRRTQSGGFIHSSTNEFVRPVHYRSLPEVIRQASHREDQQNSNCRIDFVGGVQERHLPYVKAVTQ